MDDELDLTNAHLHDDALREIALPETLKVGVAASTCGPSDFCTDRS